MLVFNKKIVAEINTKTSKGEQVVVKVKTEPSEEETSNKIKDKHKVDSVTTGTMETKMHFAGTLSNYLQLNSNQNIPDEYPIANWKQYNIGPYTKKLETGTIYDFGTTYLEKPYAKLGELRKYIQEKYK